MDIYVRSPPIFSFSLTRGSNPFSSNFSSISIALHRRGEFFLWCLLCGGFLYSQLSLYRPRQAKCCLLLLTAAALLPYAPEQLPVCAILHTLLALAAALLFLYNLFYLSLQLYFSSPAPARYSQTPSNTAFFSKLTHSLDSPAARGRPVCAGVPVFTAPFDVLTRLTGFKLTRGMLCAVKRKKMPGIEEICAGARRIAILENVENPTNVGAIFRSAAALFMDAVLLTPGCSDPLYRRASRVSMGTVFQVPWTYIPKGDWAENSMETLKKLGFRTAAMALSDRSVSIADPALSQEEKLAIILGTEGDGLAASTIAACDYTVKIPMSHGVDSLNVAAASAVAFWQLGMGNRK